MKSLLLKKGLYVGSYVLAALIIEFITFNSMGIGVFPSYFWLDIAILFFIATLIFIVPSFTAQTILILIMLGLQIVLSIVNHSLYGMSNMVFSLSMLNLAKEVGGVFTNEFIDFFFVVGLLFVFVAECVTLFFMRRVRAKVSFRLNAVVLLLFIFCTVSGFSSSLYYVALDSFTTASADDALYIYKDDTYLFDTQFLTAKAYKKFGTFGFYYKNIVNFFNVSDKASEEERNLAMDNLDKYFSDGEWNSELSPYEGNENLMTGKFEGQNVVLIVVETGEWYAINKEYTPTLYALANQGWAMTEYYARDKTNHSEAISVLGSYPSDLDNSIAPALSNPAGLLDHNFAFTLPNILQENGYTTNYFHANIGTYYNRTDTYGDDGIFGIDKGHFLDNMDRLKGYYEKKGFYDFDKDSEVLSQYFDEFTYQDTNDQAFFTMMMTLISHGHYDDLLENGDYTSDLTETEKEELSEAYTVKGLETYYERIDGFASTYIDDKFAITLDKEESKENEEAYLRYKRYQAGIMDLDVGVNRLIHGLQEDGELDNTTFVFYADHNAYYSQQSYRMKEIPTSEYWNLKHYNIPFFIWSGNCMDLNVNTDLYQGVEYTNEEIKEVSDGKVSSIYEGAFYYPLSFDCGKESEGGKKITKFCNSFDILPTLLDLLGYDFNSNLYQGRSLFVKDESVFVSREAGIFVKGMYTDGDRVFVDAHSLTDGSIVSEDGEIRFSGDKVFVQISGEEIQIDQSEVKNYLYLDKSENFIVYDLDKLFDEFEDDYYLMNDSVTEFLLKSVDYYDKQEFLEDMYRYDYFKDREISDLVKKL